MADDPDTPFGRLSGNDVWRQAQGRPAIPATPLRRPDPPKADPQPDPFPTTVLAARLLYAAAMGWLTFPLKIERKPDGKRVKKSWKSARYSDGARWGQTRAPAVIREDERTLRFKDYGAGIPTGSTNGIMVLEYDTVEGHGVDGEASLRALEAEHGPLPETLEAESPTGSRHKYLGIPEGVRIKNSTSEIAPGVDIRGEGGMAAAPPSRRDDGVYRWLNWGTPVAMAPDWLIAKCRIDETAPKKRTYHTRGGGRITLERIPKPIPPDLAATPEDVTDAESALLALPLDYARDADVVRLLRAAYWAGVRFETALAWCGTDAMKRLQPGGSGETWLAERWRTFADNPRAGGTGPSGGVGPGTLYREVYARRPGWIKPSEGGDASQNVILPTLPSPRPSASNREAFEAARRTAEEAKRREEEKRREKERQMREEETKTGGGSGPGGGSAPSGEDDDDEGRYPPLPGTRPKPSDDDKLPQASDAWNPWQDIAVPPFPLDALPDSLRRWVAERASATGSDAAGFAMAMIAAISGAIDHRVKVKPKQNDDYFVSVSLWALIVGMPSVRKSAPIDGVEYWLLDSDRRDFAAYAAAQAEAEARGDDPDEIPKPRVRVLNDATSEGIMDLLSEQQCGCILIRDELSGWIGAMDKYGGGGKGAAQDRATWVKAHGGGPFMQRRAKFVRATANLSAAILGAIQPDRLLELGRLDSDGMLQRFLVVMMRKARPSQDIARDPAVTRAISTLFRTFESFIPMVIPMSAEARAIYQTLDEDMTIALSTTDPSPAFGAFCGKLPRSFATLALILHCVALAEGRATAAEEISEATARAAECIVRAFLIPHGFAFYSLLADAVDLSHQRSIAAAICRHTKPVIRTRHLMRSVHHLNKLRAADVQAALFPFVGGGWLTPVERGYDNSQWRVTSGLAERFAREVEAMATLAADIRQRIMSEREVPE